MKLLRYYRNAVIYPSIFILLFCTVYSFTDNYLSNPLKAKSVVIMSIVPAIFYSLLVCVLSLTIFLNKIQKLNRNIIWNLLTWFLLPAAYISMILLHDLGFRIKYDFGFGNSFLYLLMMTVPYVSGLYWTFIKFRKEVSAANDLTDEMQTVQT